MTVTDEYPVPTAGRIVLYSLTDLDAQQINKRRADYNGALRHAIPPAVDGRQNHMGNPAVEGDQYPAMIVRVWSYSPGVNTACNLQVFLDGNDTYWATSRSAHTEPKPGSFTWPNFAPSATELITAMAEDGGEAAGQ